eukprot:m.129513 g.129513  ORF g.129513 m.129513 type:complete len:58 (+) comp9461_c0_seq9:1690-1863(+)
MQDLSQGFFLLASFLQRMSCSSLFTNAVSHPAGANELHSTKGDPSHVEPFFVFFVIH